MFTTSSLLAHIFFPSFRFIFVENGASLWRSTCDTCIHEVSLPALDEFILLFLQPSEHKLYRLMRFSEGDAHATTLGVCRRKIESIDAAIVNPFLIIILFTVAIAMTTWWPTETMRACFDLLRCAPKIPPVENVLLNCVIAGQQVPRDSNRLCTHCATEIAWQRNFYK